MKTIRVQYQYYVGNTLHTSSLVVTISSTGRGHQASANGITVRGDSEAQAISKLKQAISRTMVF